MNYTDEEVQLISGWNDVRKAFVAAKENRHNDPEAYDKAKADMSAMRAEWRGIREATAPAKVEEGDDTASPVTLSAPATVEEIAAAQEAGN